MTFQRRPRAARPLLPHEVIGKDAAHPKPHLVAQNDEQTDTRGLRFRKIHPERFPEYLKWLHFKPCSIEGKTNQRTGIKHVCWSPAQGMTRRFLSDPMHTGKSYSGALKRTDSGAFPGCRHSHREQESNMDRFDSDYGINRHELADAFFAEFLAEQERRS